KGEAMKQKAAIVTLLVGLSGCTTTTQEALAPPEVHTGARYAHSVPGMEGPMGQPVPVVAQAAPQKMSGAELARATMAANMASGMPPGMMPPLMPPGMMPPGMMPPGAGPSGVMLAGGSQYPGAHSGIVQAGAYQPAGGPSGVMQAGAMMPPA